MINEIYLDDEVSKQYSVEGSTRSLSNLNKINIFLDPTIRAKADYLLYSKY
jgi:hypothetical protein